MVRHLKKSIDWFINNSMIANTDQFQIKILSKDATNFTDKFKIYDNETETTKSAKLIGLELE